MSEQEEKREEKHEKLTVTVVDEDDGHEGKIHTESHILVSAVIAEMYQHIIKRPAQPGDRLRCVGSGQDVFQYATLTIGAYTATHCHSREWLFAGQTGGA
jgi:hypothetical protein